MGETSTSDLLLDCSPLLSLPSEAPRKIGASARPGLGGPRQNLSPAQLPPAPVLPRVLGAHRLCLMEQSAAPCSWWGPSTQVPLGTIVHGAVPQVPLRHQPCLRPTALPHAFQSASRAPKSHPAAFPRFGNGELPVQATEEFQFSLSHTTRSAEITQAWRDSSRHPRTKARQI